MERCVSVLGNIVFSFTAFSRGVEVLVIFTLFDARRHGPAFMSLVFIASFSECCQGVVHAFQDGRLQGGVSSPNYLGLRVVRSGIGVCVGGVAPLFRLRQFR